MTAAHDAGKREVVTAALVAERQRFLAFLIRRVGDVDAAEDLLQTAVLRAVRKSDSLRDEERVVPWLYRLLRNIIADHLRHEATVTKAEEIAANLDVPVASADDLESVVCSCVGSLLETLPSSQAELLRLVELEELAPAQVAERLHVTPGTLRTRLHRARSALRERVEHLCRTCARHGCLDCTCGGATPAM